MIEKMLVLSTAHISEKTAKILDSSDLSYPVIDKEKYGWIIPIIDKSIASLQTEYNLPADLTAVMKYAVTKDCAWIMFDGDADILKDLVTYQW